MLVKYLFANGAKVNDRDNERRTALMMACWSLGEGGGYCVPNAAVFLVEHGADVNARDKIGRTPLILLANLGSASETDAVALAKHLVSHGCKA